MFLLPWQIPIWPRLSVSAYDDESHRYANGIKYDGVNAQAGIDTEIITSNLTLILGSVLISFTIAFGLGARDVITRLLFGFYSRKNFEVGQRIKYKKIEGTIQQIDNICITVKTKEETIVIPIKDFVDDKVRIL